MTTPTREQVIQASPPESYTASERAFHLFWYSHMLGDLMQPPLSSIDNATAAYIYAAARAQALDEAVAACDGERLHDDTGHPTDIGYMQAIGDCKSAIEQLKGKP